MASSRNDVSLTLFYATNRKHIGAQRFKPDGYSGDFSSDGAENLRVGQVTIKARRDEIARRLKKRATKDTDNGVALADYFTECSQRARAKIVAYKEDATTEGGDELKDNPLYGSQQFFADLHGKLSSKHQQSGQPCDVLVYIHGYNVSWHEAVGAACALGWMQNSVAKTPKSHLEVVLFSWPSDGSILPFFAYASDRADASSSGHAFGRGLLKLRDFLREISAADRCERHLHLLCHSMGNYVLEHALARLATHHDRPRWPRLFEQVFLCSPDVDEDSLEEGKPLGQLHQICAGISVYYNRADVGLAISDYTKGNPDRLGESGAARPGRLHHKVTQVDCRKVAHGLVEHSYYLRAPATQDIRYTIDAVPADARKRKRQPSEVHGNCWILTG